MSHQATAWALEVRVGDPTLKALLMAIAHRADRATWSCWPSLACLAYDTEVSKRTIQRKLEELQERGFIRIENRRRTDGTQENSLITITGGQIVTLRPPVDKNATTGGQKPGVPVDTGVHRKEQEEQEEQEETAREGIDLLGAPVAAKSRKKAKVSLEKGFKIDERIIEYARSKGFKDGPPIQNMLDAFRDRHLALDSRFADWFAAWRTWVNNEIKFNAGRKKPSLEGVVWRDNLV